MVVTLTYLRRNRVQCELAETYGVSQSTISRAIVAVTPLLARALARFVPVAEDLVAGRQYIVDGTLLPCWSWADHPGLHSGKHKTTGMNVQVVCTLDGELVWISDPIEGARHDVFCLDESGVLDTLNHGDWIGDKGYVGRGMITPIKKTTDTELLYGRRRSTRPSTRPAPSSNASSPTSKTGESSTPTTGARSTPSPRRSPPQLG